MITPGRPAAEMAYMRVERDLNHLDLKEPPPLGLTAKELKNWKYQRYIKDYLRCVASVDDSVGQLLDWLEAKRIRRKYHRDLHQRSGLFSGRSRLV